MQIVDTVISREGGNSVWANVVFLGNSGESVSVRLPCPVPTGGPVGRNRIIKRAAALLRDTVESEAFERLGEQVWPDAVGRFGAAPEAPVLPQEPWRSGPASGKE